MQAVSVIVSASGKTASTPTTILRVPVSGVLSQAAITNVNSGDLELTTSLLGCGEPFKEVRVCKTVGGVVVSEPSVISPATRLAVLTDFVCLKERGVRQTCKQLSNGHVRFSPNVSVPSLTFHLATGKGMRPLVILAVNGPAIANLGG